MRNEKGQFIKGHKELLKGENEVTYQDEKIIKFIAESKKYGNKEVTIDAEDWGKVKKYRWYPHTERKTFYIIAKDYDNNIMLKLHRVILNLNNSEIQADHKNHDTADNRKENLRVCTASENLKNRGKQRNNTSGYKGVYWSKKNKKWISFINFNKKMKYLGSFDSIDKAAISYNIAAIEHHGEFAKLNNIMAARHGSR